MDGKTPKGSQAAGVRKRRNWLTIAIVAAAALLIGYTIMQATRTAKPQQPNTGAEPNTTSPTPNPGKSATPGAPVALEIAPVANKPQPPATLQVRAEKGYAAPDFTVTDMATGKSVKLSDLRGKPVYINFWATWCPWCKVEMPDIQKVYQSRKDDIYVLLVDADVRENQDMIKQFAHDYGISLPMMFDPKGEAANQYLVRALPTSVFIDKRGVITTIYPGALNERQLIQFLNEASK